MKLLATTLLLSLSIVSCTNNSPANNENVVTDSTLLITTDSATTVKTEEDKTEAPSENQEKSKASLVLSVNELRYVNRTTGSSKEIAFGTPEEQILNMVSNLLNSQPTDVGINSECGAGPLKMATWNNGLTLMLKEKKTDNTWEFVGWYMGTNPSKKPGVTTMANIGIGSTREQLESAYAIKVEKTSLGNEFSTVPGGLYGILSGSGENATITSLWSGTSCIFR